MRSVSDSRYWSDLYRRREDGWEKGVPAPAVLRMGRRLKPGRVAVLGCGRGHEVMALARAGWEAWGLDFAPEPLRDARRLARQAGLAARFVRVDVLDPPAPLRGRFDAVCEHTCFCAIDPSRRDDYVRAAAALLKPGGRFFGLFYAHGKPGGPPFDVTVAEVRRRFEPCFRVVRLARARESHPGREGKELEALFYSRARQRR